MGQTPKKRLYDIKEIRGLTWQYPKRDWMDLSPSIVPAFASLGSAGWLLFDYQPESVKQPSVLM
jgi:hypothetical protein